MGVFQANLHRVVVPAAGAVVGVLAHASAWAQEAGGGAVKTLPETGDMTGAILEVAGMLCLLIAVLLVGFWALRRFGSRAGLGVFGQGDLKIEGTMGLGAKKSIVVVRFLNKRMVLGVTDASINLLTEMDTDHDDDQKDFGKTLDEARAKDGAS